MLRISALAPLLVAAASILPQQALAAEGMWLPSQAPAIASRLQKGGLEIAPEALANLHAAPMNAIVSLGGCSASFVSPEGLVATNHHCAYGSIQYNSTPEQDYLTNGFLATDKAHELPAAPGSRILVMEDMRDVTTEVMAGIRKNTTGSALIDGVERNSKALIAACESTPGYRCDVKSYFGGSQWILQKMLEVRDVRLVHAPAGAIGNFGGETDNWMWPRHTGDYSFYRAYVGPDGRPAPFARENIPYRPSGWLTISRTDLKDGDFVMIAGYPGTTQRYRTAAETRFYFNDYYPLQQRLLASYSDLITRETRTAAEKIAYAAILQRADNYKKKILGQIEAAARADLVGHKDAQDRMFSEWGARRENVRRHAMAITTYDEVINRDLPRQRAALINQTLDRAQLLKAARDLYRFANERQKPDSERALGFQDRDRATLIDRLNLISRRFIPHVDRAILEQALAEVRKLPPGQRNMALDAAISRIGLDRLYADTRLADPAERLAWLDRPVDAFNASDDPFIQIAVESYAADQFGEQRSRDLNGERLAASIPYMKTLEAYRRSLGDIPYPDANGSLRLTFGKVTGRQPVDGKAWLPFTTTAGLLEKETGKEPFNSPPRLLEAVRKAQASGDWAGLQSESLGTLPVNFLSDTDITNGNSGSAVLNARGEFVGLAFDGTLDGMLSDWAYSASTTRTISLDWRYMLWVMKEVDGAGALLHEMGID